MKPCNKCGDVKPLDQFNKHRTNRDGKENVCKGCKNKKPKGREGFFDVDAWAKTELFQPSLQRLN